MWFRDGARMTIDKIIKKRREQMGYTQKGLAEKVGMSNTTIGNYERGKDPDFHKVQIILHALGLKCQIVEKVNE